MRFKNNTHRIKLTLCCAFLLMLSACSSNPVVQKTFDFGAPVIDTHTNSSAKSTTAIAKEKSNVEHSRPWTLKLAEIRVTNSLESEAMLYRLLYNNEQELVPYANSRWSMPPAQLLNQRIKSYINQFNGVVISANEIIQDAPILRLELEEFSQHFTSPYASYATIQFRASLIQRNGMITQKHFAATSTSATADAAGGAKAMPQATNLALTELLAWIQTQIK